MAAATSASCATGASTTTVGAVAPRSARTSGSAATAPSPKRIPTGRWKENGSTTERRGYPAAGLRGVATGHEYAHVRATDHGPPRPRLCLDGHPAAVAAPARLGGGR